MHLFSLCLTLCEVRRTCKSCIPPGVFVVARSASWVLDVLVGKPQAHVGETRQQQANSISLFKGIKKTFLEKRLKGQSPPRRHAAWLSQKP